VINRRVADDEAEQIEDLLPELIEFVLAPYLGLEEAKRVASEQPAPPN
jgi:hypothetical protein